LQITSKVVIPAYSTHSQGSVATRLGTVGSVTISWLQIFWQIYRWKDFENRSPFDAAIRYDKNLYFWLGRFSYHPSTAASLGGKKTCM